MQIYYVHFYVENSVLLRHWFTGTLGFQSLASLTDFSTHTEIVGSGTIRFVFSSPLAPSSQVANFLQRHPAGVVDLAIATPDLNPLLWRLNQQGVKVLQPPQVCRVAGQVRRWATIVGWGGFCHTLVEHQATDAWWFPPTGDWADPVVALADCPSSRCNLLAIDHVVLNVSTGDLTSAITWYEKGLGLQTRQHFTIQTPRSGLRSAVMVDSTGAVQLPINEPTTANSQIQEFLEINRGPGIQHIALETQDIVATVAQLRQQGVPLISVPDSYYEQLQAQGTLPLSWSQWQAIRQQQILVDWEPERPAILLQTFTQPIFDQPTVFLEVIQRQFCHVQGETYRAQGFGERNFQMLFEAIEREQQKRGSL